MTRLTAAAYGLQIAGVAAAGSVLVLWGARRAEELEVVGALTPELVLFAMVTIIASRLIPGIRGTLPAGLVVLGGAAVTAVGFSLMAWTVELGLFTVGGVLAGVGVAPALVLHRVVITSAARGDERRRLVSRYWAAAAFGAALPLCLDVVGAITAATGLWAAAALTTIACLALLPGALDHDADVRTQETIAVLDAPWVKRSTIAAAAAGAALVAAARPAASLLQDEWQRSPTQQAAVLAVAPVAALLANTLGDWYHRLGTLTGSRRADAIGVQLMVAGVAAAIGGVSFTYIGVIVAWSIAGAALGLALAGLDGATFASIEPPVRRLVAAKQVTWFVGGAAIAAGVDAAALSAWSDQWRIVVPCLALVLAGWRVRRFADPAVDRGVISTAATRTSVPRRVATDGARTPPMLEVESLEVAYGQVQVLFSVDLRVEHGEIVALLGPNGAGKTTLLRAVSGLEPTIGGRVMYAGLDVTRTKPTWRAGMGLQQIVGGEAVAGPLTVEENLRLFASTVPASERHAAIDGAFEAFGRLRERRHQRAATLSGGEKQMLALAKALMVRPQLLLIDEFSLGLAPTVIADLLPLVRRIAAQGTAVLIVEQSVQIALSLADSAYVMEKGEIAHHGSAAALREQPDLLRAAYLEGLTTALADEGDA